MRSSASDLSATVIVCVLALIALARSEAPPVAARSTLPEAARAARPLPTPAAVARLRAAEPLELNQATVGDLVLLPGIGPKLAQRIVEERARRGGFDQIDELLAVRGVGRVVLERIRPLLRVDPGPRPAETSQVDH